MSIKTDQHATFAWTLGKWNVDSYRMNADLLLLYTISPIPVTHTTSPQPPRTSMQCPMLTTLFHMCPRNRLEEKPTIIPIGAVSAHKKVGYRIVSESIDLMDLEKLVCVYVGKGVAFIRREGFILDISRSFPLNLHIGHTSKLTFPTKGFVGQPLRPPPPLCSRLPEKCR